MSEKILWSVLAVVALIAAGFFFLVERDPVNSGAVSLICLCLLNFRAQATS